RRRYRARMSVADPAWAYEEAVLRAYDPGWAVRGEVERSRVAELLGPWLVDGVEHVGSTAVPALPPNPVIAVMASVPDASGVVAGAGPLPEEDGWSQVPPELDQGAWRRFYVKPDASGQHRLAHLHVITAGEERWSQQLAFRDALRGDRGLKDEYEALKHRLS